MTAAQTRAVNASTDPSFSFRIPGVSLNSDAGVLRLMARDASKGTNVDEMGLVGTISFNLK